MTGPAVQRLYDVVEATWPPASAIEVGPWTIRRGLGGGSRVSAATARGMVQDQDIPDAEAAMAGLGQVPLFMLRDGDGALDSLLAARGYAVKDPVNLYSAPLDKISPADHPRHMTFQSWPPLAIQTELWSEAHIGPERIAVMARAQGPKVTLLARHGQVPAGTVYVGLHDGIAMFHALEVSPDHRRHGIARSLVLAAAAWARGAGATHVALVVTKANEGANLLYASMGFSLVGEYHYRIKQG